MNIRQPKTILAVVISAVAIILAAVFVRVISENTGENIDMEVAQQEEETLKEQLGNRPLPDPEALNTDFQTLGRIKSSRKDSMQRSETYSRIAKQLKPADTNMPPDFSQRIFLELDDSNNPDTRIREELRKKKLDELRSRIPKPPPRQ